MWDGSQSPPRQFPPSSLSSSQVSQTATMASLASTASAMASRQQAAPSNSQGQQTNDKNKDVASNHGGHGKSGKAASSRNKNNHYGTPGAAGGGFRGHDDHQRRNKNNHPQNHNYNHHHYASGGRRSNHHVGSGSQSRFELAEADEFEVGSVFRAGSKKQNKNSANHLLNFYTDRRTGVGQNHRGGGGRNKGDSNVASRYAKKNAYVGHKYVKEQYLQANCQFVVKSGADYTVHLSDPDTLVNWDLIEQVGLKSSGVPSCPICLYPPNAAKLARCGHVFCWACILHYLALSDDTSRKCPICCAQICKDDLKSVVSMTHADINVGDEIEMSLMRRERNSLFAVPVGQYFPDINERHPSVSTQRNTAYSQLLLASPDEVARHILAPERSQLEAQFEAEKDQPEACFIEEALKHQAEREQGNLLASALHPQEIAVLKPNLIDESLDDTTSSSGSTPEEEVSFSPDVLELEEDELRPRHVSTSSDGGSSIAEESSLNMITTVTAEDLDISTLNQPSSSSPINNNPGGQPAPKDTFYFYQSSDGQPIFLHALNVQMLVQQYGCFEKCPKTIRGKIQEKDSASMTEELRNKLRYLRHLPVTCNFEVCEIRLDESFVSKDTMLMFKDQLDARHSRRRRRARDEKRREKRIQVEENKLMGKFPEAKLRIESEFHFPQVGSDAAVNLVSANDPDLNQSMESIETNLGTSPGSLLTSEAAGLSFANMLRSKPSAACIASASLQKNPIPAGIATSIRARNDSSCSEPDPEGYVPPPPQSSIGDALAMALNRAQLEGGVPSSGGKGKKGKKKVKGIVLGGAPRPNM